MTEERDDIIVLIDESGAEEEFEYIDSVEYDGNEYVILSPAKENENMDEDFDEVIVILKVEENEDGEESFVTVDDDDLLDAVFEEFKENLSDDFTFDIDEDDDDDEDFDVEEYGDSDDDYDDEDDDEE